MANQSGTVSGIYDQVCLRMVWAMSRSDVIWSLTI